MCIRDSMSPDVIRSEQEIAEMQEQMRQQQQQQQLNQIAQQVVDPNAEQQQE